MVDVARALFIVGALLASMRARYRTGIAIAIVCALLLGVEVLFPFRHPAGFDRVEIAFGAIFIGPSALPHAPPFAMSRLLMDPTHHLAMAVLAAIGAARALALASELPPDGQPSRRLDRAGLRFIAVGVASALLSVSGLLSHALPGD